jgi:predicted nucleic acid-binding protein
VTLAAVSDAGPLIHLADIDSLELLSAFDTLLSPETVYEEIESGGVPDGFADLSYELGER